MELIPDLSLQLEPHDENCGSGRLAALYLKAAFREYVQVVEARRKARGRSDPAASAALAEALAGILATLDRLGEFLDARPGGGPPPVPTAAIPQREGMVDELSVEDTLLLGLDFHLPAVELHCVSNELAIQDNLRHLTGWSFGQSQFWKDAKFIPNSCDNTERNIYPQVEEVPIAKSVVPPQETQEGYGKGQKRKPAVLLQRPKAPVTGYVLYLNENRKLYKDLPSPEVTKLLGEKWSQMTVEEKQAYLDRGKEERERYKQELSQLKKSDAYQSYHLEQQIKCPKTDGTLGDEDNELHCQSCNQWFSTHHNKKEHLNGKQHFQNTYGRKRKETSACGNNISCSLCDKNKTTDVRSLRMKLMQISEEHDREYIALHERISFLKSQNLEFIRKINNLTERQIQANEILEDEKKKHEETQNKVYSVLAFPTLVSTFYVFDENDPKTESGSYIFSSRKKASAVPGAPVLPTGEELFLNSETVP